MGSCPVYGGLGVESYLDGFARPCVCTKGQQAGGVRG